MAKFTFNHRTEWSDWSEDSPQSTGQFPSAVILPDGARVDMSEGTRYEAIHIAPCRPRATYFFLGENVRIRESYWGDDGSRRIGRVGSKLEVLAPKGSEFLFAQYCPGCYDQTGEVGSDDLTKARNAPERFCADCKAKEAEWERAQEEMERQQAIAQEEWEKEQEALVNEAREDYLNEVAADLGQSRQHGENAAFVLGFD